MFIKNFISGKTNYSKDSTFYDDTNKKVIDKMKYEYGGATIDQFIGLKSKMFSIKKENRSESSTAKGVNTQHSSMSLKMFCLIKMLLDIR